VGDAGTEGGVNNENAFNNNSGGCGCTTPGGEPSGAGVAAILGLAVLGGARLRRRSK
jgi:MYXO-CTERM domain-containing protein